jgi:hypothetical protein
MPRWLTPLIFTIIGIAMGLFYGWIINPVKFVDTTPASLRVDYRTDYVLMVAEGYHADQNVELAVRRLAIFGSETPATLAAQALQMGRQTNYSEKDLSLLQELTRAMQAYQPISTPAGIAPGGGTP